MTIDVNTNPDLYHGGSVHWALLETCGVSLPISLHRCYSEE